MYTGYVWGITMLIVGALVALGAVQLVSTAAVPGLVGQAARNLERRGLLAQIGMFALGAVGVALFIAALTAFGKGGPVVKVLLLVPVFGGALSLAPALAAASLCVGARLPSPGDVGRPWRRVVRGTAALGLSWVIPFVGWFVLLPGTLAMGLGATALAVFQPEGRREAARELLLRAPADEALA